MGFNSLWFQPCYHRQPCLPPTDTNILVPRALQASMVETSRKVVVIGGGIIGTSTAYFLKQRGVDATILEASSIAAGASGKAGGT